MIHSMMMKISMLIISFVGIFFLNGCDCSDKQTNEPDVVSSQHTDDAIMFAGGSIEGVSVCYEDTCARTSSDGYITFKKSGSYTFYLNGMYLTEQNITKNTRVISPYTLFEDEMTSRMYALLLHACDRSDDVEDDVIELSLSPYLPAFESFEALLDTQKLDSNLSFSMNDHNVTVDTVSGVILRDGIEWVYTPIEQDVYRALESVESFFDRAEGKKMALFHSFETHTLNRLGPMNFKLGDVYSLELQVQRDRLVLDFIDLESGVESEARFISVVDSTLQSDLVDLEIVK